MHSQDFEGEITLNVTRPVDVRQKNWGDYLRGVVWALQQDFVLSKGVQGVVRGSLPVGGLSSSAALLCGFVLALDEANGLGLTKMQLIHYASLAERKYVGLRNGILDQACVVLCEADKLLYLDTETSEYKLLPFGDGNYKQLPFKIGIFFSGVTRKLTGTDYNLRVTECKTAAWMMQAYEDVPLKEMDATTLRAVDASLFKKYETVMPNRFAKRARHFYTECERVTKGVEAWQHGDIEAFGKLIFESCKSSIDNYECGSPELIALHEIMRTTDGIYGGRFSGAGFKGACIALVDPAKEDAIRQAITTQYLAKYPQYNDTFDVFFCEPDNGVRLCKAKIDEGL
jgi:galactokinase